MSDQDGQDLLDALRLHGSVEELSLLDKFDQFKEYIPIYSLSGPTEYSIGHDKWLELASPLAERLLKKLITGSATARGFSPNFDPRIGVELIAPSSWRQAQVDWVNNKVWFGETCVTDVKVHYLASEIEPNEQTINTKPSPDAEIAFFENELVIGDQRWPLRGKVQIAIMERLARNAQAGKREQVSSFVASTCPGSGAIEKAFAKSAHWEQIKAFVRQKDGRIWLEPTKKL